MSTIQVSDQMFVVGDPADISAHTNNPRNWKRWFPSLTLTTLEDRKDKGIRWQVTGALQGTSEIWLEPMLDGAIVHYFLHCEPTTELSDVSEEIRKRRIAGKNLCFELRRLVDGSRPAGCTPAWHSY